MSQVTAGPPPLLTPRLLYFQEELSPLGPLFEDVEQEEPPPDVSEEARGSVGLSVLWEHGV